jgi:hypothetical protein
MARRSPAKPAVPGSSLQIWAMRVLIEQLQCQMSCAAEQFLSARMGIALALEVGP